MTSRSIHGELTLCAYAIRGTCTRHTTYAPHLYTPPPQEEPPGILESTPNPCLKSTQDNAKICESHLLNTCDECTQYTVLCSHVFGSIHHVVLGLKCKEG